MLSFFGSTQNMNELLGREENTNNASYVLKGRTIDFYRKTTYMQNSQNSKVLTLWHARLMIIHKSWNEPKDKNNINAREL